MRSIILAAFVAAFLVGCGPAISSFTPRERLVDLGQPDFSLPVEGPVVVAPPAVEVPVVAPPVVGRPVEPPVFLPEPPEAPVEPPVVTPEPPVPPVTPEPPVGPPEPPVEPPGGPSDGCRVKVLPPASAVERIDKCPKERAVLTRRR